VREVTRLQSIAPKMSDNILV